MATAARQTTPFVVTRAEPDVVLCDVSRAEPDLGTVDALARLQLVARRQRCRVVLCDAPAELRELIEVLGLGDVFAE